MITAFKTRWLEPIKWSVPCLGVLLIAGCGNSEIKTYRVAKEDNTPKISTAARDEGAAAPMVGHGNVPLPRISWTLPKGWREVSAEGMRKASFEVSGPGGKIAQVMIIPLPGASNIEMDSVNLWREELGLDPLKNKDDLAAQATSASVGDTKGDLFEMNNAEPKAGQTSRTRTLGAIAERDGILWFVKMSGSDDLVAEQKPSFVDFLKSLTFEKLSPTQLASAEAPASSNSGRVPPSSEGPSFKAPANWQPKTPGPMITAAYTVANADGPAEVTISKFPGAVGGLAANINRWRGQLGLPSLDQAEAEKSAEMVEIDGKKNAYMVDLQGTNVRTSQPARMVALGVPRGGETWFYKLIGQDSVVGKEKDAFLKFVVSAY